MLSKLSFLRVLGTLFLLLAIGFFDRTPPLLSVYIGFLIRFISKSVSMSKSALNC